VQGVFAETGGIRPRPRRPALSAFNQVSKCFTEQVPNRRNALIPNAVRKLHGIYRHAFEDRFVRVRALANTPANLALIRDGDGARAVTRGQNFFGILFSTAARVSRNYPVDFVTCEFGILARSRNPIDSRRDRRQTAAQCR